MSADEGKAGRVIQSNSTSSENLTVRLACPLGDYNLPSSQSEGAKEEVGQVESGPEETTSLKELLAEVSNNEPSREITEGWSLAQLKRLKRELRALGKTDEERIRYLQDRLTMLKSWIQTSFHIDDPENYLDSESSKEQNATIITVGSTQSTTDTLTLPGLTSPTTTATTTKTGDDAKPVLRIKLVDDKSRTMATGGAGQKSTTSSKVPVRAGTGSKNLSRMMKPGTEGSTASALEQKSKLANQIPIMTFLNYIEPFFKPIDDADLFSLENTSRFVDPVPFVIPPLGKRYEEKWRESYGYECSAASTSPSGKRRRIATSPRNNVEKGAKVIAIRERLLAMIVDENLTVPEAETAVGSASDLGDSSSSSSGVLPTGNASPNLSSDGLVSGVLSVDSQSGSSPPPSHLQLPTSKLEILSESDFYHVEERIRRELAEAGLAMFVPSVDYQEDDPICMEMRTLQRRLSEQVCVNHYRKRRLAALVREKLPAQEFYNLLGEIDGQIQNNFAKKGKTASRKRPKKGNSTSSSGSVPQITVEYENPSSSTTMSGLGDGISLVDTRYRLVEAFRDLVPPQFEFLSTSNVSIFEPDAEERVLQYACEHGGWLPVPDNPIESLLQQQQRSAKSHGAHPAFPHVFPILDQSASSVRDGHIS